MICLKKTQVIELKPKCGSVRTDRRINMDKTSKLNRKE